MNDRKNSNTISGVPELREACYAFDDVLRAFMRNPSVSHDLAYDVIRLLFQVREMERKLNKER